MNHTGLITIEDVHPIAIGIIFLAALENLWPSIIGFMSAPRGFIFLGTVHHLGDYFYYLSQFFQGSTRLLTTVDLYTTEPLAPSFIGWSNVLLGRIFHLAGISPIPAYHFSIGILTIGALLAAWALCRESFQKTTAALIAFFLFWLFHAFPLMRDGVSSYGDYWNNYAVPRVRLGGVPHQLITVIVSTLIVYFVIRITQKRHRARSMFIYLALCGFVLAGLQPVLYGLISAGILLTLVIYQAPDRKKIILSLKHAVPAIATLLLSGLVPLLYLSRRFESLPFSQMKAWEAVQQTILTPEHFLTATGPVFLMAIFSIPLALSRRTFTHSFMVIFTAISLILFLSPIPSLIGISHVRFMSTLTILSLSITAGLGIYSLISAPSRWTKAAGITLVLLVIGITFPNHIKTLRLASAFTPTNTAHYLPERDYALLEEARAGSNTDDIFLVADPYDALFPALTGRKTYYGHPLLTINAEEKRSISRAFFSPTMDPIAQYDFVRKNNISWIIAGQSQKKSITARWMKLVSESDTLMLYQVQK